MTVKKVKKLLDRCLAQGPRWYRMRQDPIEPPTWRDVYQLTLNSYAMALEDVIKALDGNTGNLERTCLTGADKGGGRPFILDPSKFSWRRAGAQSPATFRMVERGAAGADLPASDEGADVETELEPRHDVGPADAQSTGEAAEELAADWVAGGEGPAAVTEIAVSPAGGAYSEYPPTTPDEGRTIGGPPGSWTVKEFAAGETGGPAVRIPVGEAPLEAGPSPSGTENVPSSESTESDS